MRTFLIVAAVAGLGALGFFGWRAWGGGATPTGLRTTEVIKTDITSAISATGTIEPEEVVDVGAQVAGMILTFGKDESGKEIDYGSAVDEGTVLARIDDSLYAADAASARAQVSSAKAGVERAQADLIQLKAKLEQATRDWERAQKLGPSDVLAQSAYDAYKAGFETAQANVSVGEAAILQAEAGVPLAEAQLRRAERNLGYCVITSPVKGVIIDRRVNIGQTVVSSLNAPSLFLIAKDLTRVEIWAAVNEADIANIRPGQPVTFTVDAYPGHSFKGEVIKTRLNASMTQNVVTYTVEIAAGNEDGRLLPYLTANARFIVEERKATIAVPNAALRWTPPATLIDPSAPAPAAAPAGGAKGSGKGRTGTLWVQSGAFVRPISVKLGLSDGAVTEVEGPDVTEGLAVVIGDDRATKSAAAPAAQNTNPFAPQMGGGRGQGQRR